MKMMRRNVLLLSTLMCLIGLYIVEAQKSDNISRLGVKHVPRFVEIDPEDGKVEVNLELSLPFLTIPLEDKKAHPGPLLNINPKGIAIFGTLLAMSAFVIPLFVNKIPEHPAESLPQYHHHHYGKEHKRTNRGLDFWNFEDSFNEIFSRNSPVTPCMQRAVCLAVAAASQSDSPTSADKIVDGLSRWFKDAINGTAIEEAIETGRQVLQTEECNTTYKGCVLGQQVIQNLLKIIGI